MALTLNTVGASVRNFAETVRKDVVANPIKTIAAAISAAAVVALKPETFPTYDSLKWPQDLYAFATSKENIMEAGFYAGAVTLTGLAAYGAVKAVQNCCKNSSVQVKSKAN